MEVELENTYIWRGLWSLINQLKWKSSHGLCSWKSSHVVMSLVMWFPISSCIWSQNLSNPHYYKMRAQFISPRSLDQWIHCFFTGPCSLRSLNSFKIQWNHLVYRDTFWVDFPQYFGYSLEKSIKPMCEIV